MWMRGSSNLVQLLDTVLVERDVLPRAGHQVHQLSVTGHFLLISGVEGLNGQVGEQALHFAVSQLAALDAGRRADTFNGRHPLQSRKTLRRERSQGSPCAFEFIDPGDSNSGSRV